MQLLKRYFRFRLSAKLRRFSIIFLLNSFENCDQINSQIDNHNYKVTKLVVSLIKSSKKKYKVFHAVFFSNSANLTKPKSKTKKAIHQNL